MGDLPEDRKATVKTDKGTVIHADLVFKTIGLPVNKEAYENSLGRFMSLLHLVSQEIVLLFEFDICLALFFSAVLGLIGTKLGRKLKQLVSMVTKLLSWYSRKTVLYP